MQAAHTPSHPLSSQVDHLVVAAASLNEGVQWCQNVLGVTPGPGGEHPLMGTHNRLFTVSSPTYPGVYFEIIAINSGAHFVRHQRAKRWFDFDDPAMQHMLAKNGPQLVHFAARTPRAEGCVHALARIGLDRGEVLPASRMTPQGELSWKITVREDGQRLFFGTLPTLIEWGDIHPERTMPPSGVTLLSLRASHPRADTLREAYAAIGLTGVEVVNGAPNLVATLQTPRGVVTLESGGI
ncbi:MAG TPA: VOC family protein [Polaromonas sp.]|uniref:VOC family protein n=1 Tax=Polaromonas sp. TaxID=1869339 RepID=UPI002D6D478A|nr:VOC family protein [Polaromonas sp.]HYW55843.1 VOC family protein [Polaromonas sp.]